MSKENTVFQAEMQTIQHAATVTHTLKPKHKSITIYSDSQAALQALENKTIHSTTTYNTILSLNKLSKHNNLTLQWIPGHEGHEGNEKADKLAKEGKNKQLEDHNKYPKPHSYYTNKLSAHFNDKLREQWKGRRINKESQLFFQKLLESTDYNSHKITKAMLTRNKEEISIITRVLSGHNCLRNHIFYAGLTYTKNCTYCVPEEKWNEDNYPIETAHHILCDCPAFSKERNNLYAAHVITEKQVFSKSTKTNLQKIAKFFKRIKVLNRPPQLIQADMSPRKNNKRRSLAANPKSKRSKT